MGTRSFGFMIVMERPSRFILGASICEAEQSQFSCISGAFHRKDGALSIANRQAAINYPAAAGEVERCAWGNNHCVQTKDAK